LNFCVDKTLEYSKLKCRYLYYIKLSYLLALVYIINYIKAEMLRWFGHAQKMTNDKMAKKIMCVETDT